MEIAGILSFGNAWQELQDEHSDSLTEIMEGINAYFSKVFEPGTKSSEGREVFEDVMSQRGWAVSELNYSTDSGGRISVRQIGSIKNRIAVQIAHPSPDFLTRWLFNHSSLAVKYGLTDIPILITSMLEDSQKLRVPIMGRLSSFETYSKQLEMLSPLSVSHKFIIIGCSSRTSLLEPHFTELQQDPQLHNRAEKRVIDRSIEFPPEYQQAGLGILSFFASYLSDKYPDQDATVRIEQSGLNVRMVVESKSGSKEIIERALHEYELIVSGKKSIEQFGGSEKLMLEMRNELRVAKFRLESQQDIIAIQNMHYQRSESHIESLMKLLGQGLTPHGDQSFNINVNPQFHNSVVVDVNQNISLAIGSISELLEVLPRDSEALLPLKDLEQSLSSIEQEQSRDNVRKSSAMSKFGRIIGLFDDGSSALKKAIDTIEQGSEVVKKLVEQYNKIASWCGLPMFVAMLN